MHKVSETTGKLQSYKWKSGNAVVYFLFRKKQRKSHLKSKNVRDYHGHTSSHWSISWQCYVKKLLRRDITPGHLYKLINGREKSVIIIQVCMLVKRQATEKCYIKDWKKAIFKMSGYCIAVKCQLNTYKFSENGIKLMQCSVKLRKLQY